MRGALQVKGGRGNVKNERMRRAEEIAVLSAPSFSHHPSERRHSNIMLYPPGEFAHFANQQITTQFPSTLPLFPFTRGPDCLTLIHTLHDFIRLHIGQNTYFILH